ncbi:MAG: DUF58 domain-containing protein [Phototrophicaceae bacterium]
MTPWLDSRTRRKLEQVMLMANRVRAGVSTGERRSSRRGSSIEFADYRNYVQGDDLRRLDWKLYARAEKPYIKIYEDEEDLTVHLFLDVSASMDFPPAEAAPDSNKFTYGRRLISGLATIALSGTDRLSLTAVSGNSLHTFGPYRGRAYLPRMFAFISALQANGGLDLNSALQTYARKERRPGLVIIVSDLFIPNGITSGLNELVGRGYEVALIHTLAPEELDPPLAGDLRLVDVETGRAQEVTIDAAMRQLYLQRLQHWQSELRLECQRRNVHYLPVSTDTPFEKIILSEMRRLRLVR